MFAGIEVDDETTALFEAAGVPSDLPRKIFDIKANILEGNTAYEIAQHATSEAGLDYDGMKIAGLTDTEIIHRLYLSRQVDTGEYLAEGVL